VQACARSDGARASRQGVRVAGELGAAAAAAAALRDLQALAARLEKLLAAQTGDPGGGAAALAAAAAAPRGARPRALLSLVRLLQLYVAGDAGAAEPELAAELARVCGDAFGAGAGVAADPGAAPGEPGDPGKTLQGPPGAGAADADAPWPDRLLDILLSLLARPAAPLPSAPLREAVEAVFRAFADAVTPVGAASSLGSLPPPPRRGLPSRRRRCRRHSARLMCAAPVFLPMPSRRHGPPARPRQLQATAGRQSEKVPSLPCVYAWRSHRDRDVKVLFLRSPMWCVRLLGHGRQACLHADSSHCTPHRAGLPRARSRSTV